MASPSNNTDMFSQTSASENSAALDAFTIHTVELENLAASVAELTGAAKQCYTDRLHYDAKCEKFQCRDSKREGERADTEFRLNIIRRRAANIGERQEAIISQVPPHLTTQSRNVVDQALGALQSVLLQIEQQKLAGVLGTIELARREFAGAHGDLLDVGSCVEAQVALADLDAALDNFRDVFERCSGERLRAIERELLRLNKLQDSEQHEVPWPPSSDEPTALEDETLVGDEEDVDVSDARSKISTLDLGSPAIPADEELGDLHLSFIDPLQFHRADPPSLVRLGAWLGLDGGSWEAAMLLNATPIQNAFTAYRAPAAGRSCAEDPERLRAVLPLFTYSRETLLNWRRSGLDQTEQKQDGIDFSAAVFASHVVCYLEGSCDVVDWRPVASGAGLDEFDVARRRWAIALQILWFLEKAFA
ncbi:hypothetical protein F5Y12DRAFT_291647 [Xylaria sp. FL1777]|nr:hypothetical protein F5Y12DRAFT_291647 [Xylaria sp. FL1777]